MNTLSLPIEISDPINARILAVSEDKLAGFQPDPLGEIAARTGIDPATVFERIKAMLHAGIIRRVRQTLMATNLARGALVAWQVPEDKLTNAFDWMFQKDPFSGHVVIRSTVAGISQTRYRLWTTLKVPQGFSMDRHCEFLMRQTGCLSYRLMQCGMMCRMATNAQRWRNDFARLFLCRQRQKQRALVALVLAAVAVVAAESRHWTTRRQRN